MMTWTHSAPYAIIYGAEYQDFPLILEDGPYATLDAARAAVDAKRLDTYRGAMIVSDWTESDGASITTGAGVVVEIIDHDYADQL